MYSGKEPTWTGDCNVSEVIFHPENSSFGRPGKRRRCRGKHQSAILLNIAARFACAKSIKEMIFEADLVFSIKGCVCLLQVEMLPPDEAETEGELSMGDDIVKTWNILPTLPLHGFCWCFDRRHEAQALRTIWSFPQIQKRRGTTKKVKLRQVWCKLVIKHPRRYIHGWLSSSNRRFTPPNSQISLWKRLRVIEFVF